LTNHTEKKLKSVKKEGKQRLMVPMVNFVDELRRELTIDRKIYNIIFGNLRKNEVLLVQTVEDLEEA